MSVGEWCPSAFVPNPDAPEYKVTRTRTGGFRIHHKSGQDITVNGNILKASNEKPSYFDTAAGAIVVVENTRRHARTRNLTIEAFAPPERILEA